jgi:lipoyl-dependent peroxiredoxin
LSQKATRNYNFLIQFNRKKTSISKSVLDLLEFLIKSTKNDMKRKATAVWYGSGKEGNGHLTTQSAVLDKTQYSFNSRFAEGIGTNPEELVAAAHAGCFTMKLSFNLSGAGFVPEELQTTCHITLENGSITESHLTLTAKVEGIDPSVFNDLVNDAEKNCPISKLLNTDITVEYTLNS